MLTEPWRDPKGCSWGAGCGPPRDAWDWGAALLVGAAPGLAQRALEEPQKMLLGCWVGSPEWCLGCWDWGAAPLVGGAPRFAHRAAEDPQRMLLGGEP